MGRQLKQPKIRSVKFNVVMNTILTTSTFLFPLITVPYVSRVLGPDNNGIVSWAFTFVGYFSLVALLGFNMYGTRECAKLRDDREKLSVVVQELLVILICSTTVVYVAFVVLVFLLPRTHDELPLMFIVGTSIWLSACGAEWFYRSIEQYEYITVRNILFKIASIVLLFVFVRQTNDYLAYAAVTVLGTTGSNVLNILRLRSFVTFSRKYEMNIRRHFKPMFAFSISSITSGMYGQIDMLLLGFSSSNYALGLYQLVFKIRNMCTGVGGSVTGVMLPRLSYYEAQEGHDQTTKLMAKNFNFLLMLGLAIISALVICADPLIMILGGNDYLPGNAALKIGAPLVLLGSIGSMQSQYMVASDQEKVYTYTNVAGLVIAIVLECIFIPLWGINGAALGLVLTELSVYCIRTYILRDFMRKVRKYTDYWKIAFAWAVASIVTAGICYAMRGWNPFVQIIIAALVFCVADGGLLVLVKESFIMSMVRKR